MEEIGRLLSHLAADLRRPSGDGRTAGSVSVLDAALSLMCFTDPQVSQTRVECLLGTLTSLLSSLGSSGCSFSSDDCADLFTACADLLQDLQRYAHHHHHHDVAGYLTSLPHAVTKAALSSCSSRAPPSIDVRESGGTSVTQAALAKLEKVVSQIVSYNDHNTALRLNFWYLDPLILKRDISEILEVVAKRPFLCLSKELHGQMHWREIVMCSVTSPTVFVEVRNLLHNWFLMTGSVVLLDTKVGLVSALLDALSRPMWWGAPFELGLKYQFSYAFFPNVHRKLLSILTGPVSCKSLTTLVGYLKTSTVPSTDDAHTALDPSDRNSNFVTKLEMVSADSAWALMLDFPIWFYFAIAMLFYPRASKGPLSKTVYNQLKLEAIDELEFRQSAAYYLSWFLSPGNEVHRENLAKSIYESTMSLSLKLESISECDEGALLKNQHVKHHRKLRIPKLKNTAKTNIVAEDNKSTVIRNWLQEFNDTFVSSCSRIGADDMQLDAKNVNVSPNLLVLRVALGMLIMSPCHLAKTDCQLLLHYVATGEIIELKKIQSNTKNNPDNADLTLCSRIDPSTRALRGACLVFSLLDTVDEMSVVLFDSEGCQVDFINQIKGKVCLYLIRCVGVVINQWECDFRTAGLSDTLLDLHYRLLRLKEQGGETFEGCEAFDDFFSNFVKRFEVL